jgi:hypothetical protein
MTHLNHPRELFVGFMHLGCLHDRHWRILFFSSSMSVCRSGRRGCRCADREVEQVCRWLEGRRRRVSEASPVWVGTEEGRSKLEGRRGRDARGVAPTT